MWPPSPERKITRPVKHKDTISLGLSVLLEEARIKVKCPQEEDKRPMCCRTGTHVYTRHMRSHMSAHTHACLPLETHTCTDSAGHASPYTFIRAHVCACSATSVHAGTRRRPVCTYPREHLLVRAYAHPAPDTHARLRVHTQAALPGSQMGSPGGPGVPRSCGFWLSPGEGPPPGRGL